MQTVALIDYGSGNLRSAQNALEKAAGSAPGAAEIRVTSDPETVAAADRIVLPGVGAFAACRGALMARPGLVEAITEAVQTRGVPFLGVCVGMQLLASRGLEFGETPGLDWIPGEVRRLTPDSPACKVPHMGWNQVHQTRRHPLWQGIADNMRFYFVHSYYVAPADVQCITGTTDYGIPFTSAIARDNIFAVQFHPEKSAQAGLRLLENFMHWNP